MKPLLLSALVAALTLPSLAQYGGGGETSTTRQESMRNERMMGVQDQYAHAYDRATVVNVRGEVMYLEPFRTEHGDYGFVNIMTQFGPEVIVLAPRHYIERERISFRRGDLVEVVGSRVTIDGKRVILARQVGHSTRMHMLRNEHGHPLWAAGPEAYAYRPGAGTARPITLRRDSFDPATVENFTGTITAIELVPKMHGSPAGSHVTLRTDRETVIIHVGPEWTFADPNLTLKVNDRLEVRGSRIMHEGQRNVVIPMEFSAHGQRIAFRDATGAWLPSLHVMVDERVAMQPGAIVLRRDDPQWGTESAYERMFRPGSMRTFTGTVERVETFQIPGSPQMGRVAVVRVGNDLIPVHLGPVQWVDQRGWRLNSGQRVTITGSDTTFQGRPVVFATDLRVGNEAWTFRDPQGRALWLDWDATAPPAHMFRRDDMYWGEPSAYNRAWRGTPETWTGTVTRVGRFAVPGSPQEGTMAHVTVGEEAHVIHLAPANWLQHKGWVLRPDERITFTGVRTTWQGSPIIYVRELRRGQDTWILRDPAGRAAWIVW